MTAPPLDDEPRLSPLAQLVAEGLAVLETEGADGLERLCGEHPDEAAELRTRLQALHAAGLVQEPREFGPYRILRTLGQGGMGVVYLCQDTRLDRLVALKALPARLAASERAAARFQREIQAVAQLRHPNIVPIYDLGTVEGAPYFTMEYVEGRTLAAQLDELRGRGVGPAVLGPEDLGRGGESDGYVEAACQLVLDVAAGLQHAHEHGVVHRDVKPDNILLGRHGRGRLFDFGLAKIEGLSGMTLTGDLAGTPFYVSPEQVGSRKRGLDVRTDVYSLGVTLYELLTLRVPFDGTSTEEVLNQIVTSEPPSPRRFNPAVPSDLETICLTALEKDPLLRYQGVDAFADDLGRFLQFRPIRARPVGPLVRTLRLLRRNRALAAAVLLALVLLVGAPIGLWQANVVIRAERDTATAAAASARAERARADEQRELAEEQRELAEQQRRLAEQQRQRADQQRQRAEDEWARAEAEARRADELLAQESLAREHAEQLSAQAEAEWVRAEAESERARLSAENAQQAAFEAADALSVARDASARKDKAIDFVMALLTPTDPYEARPDRTVADVLRRGAAEVGAALEGETRLQCSVRQALGKALLGQGDHVAAAEQFTIARDLALATHDPSMDDIVAVSESSLAVIHTHNGHLEAALASGFRALEIERRLFGDGSQAVSTDLNNVAIVVAMMNRDVEAEQLFRQLLPLRTKLHGEDSVEVAEVLINIGQTIGYDPARVAEKRALLERAVAIYRRQRDADDPALAAALGGLAACHQVEGDLDATIALREEVLGLLVRRLGAGHPEVADAQVLLAFTHIKREEYLPAEPLLSEAAATYARAYPGGHGKRVSALRWLASVLAAMERPEEAEAPLRAALAEYERIDPASTSVRRVELLESLADLLTRLDKRAEFEQLLADNPGLVWPKAGEVDADA